MKKHRLRHFLIALLILFALFNTAVIGVAAYVFTHPKQTWAFVQRRFLPADLKVSWQALKFEPRKETWFDWDLDLQIDGLKVEKGKPKLLVAPELIRLRFSFALKDFKVAIHEVTVEAKSPLRFEPDDSAPSSPQSYYQQIKSLMGYAAKLHRIIEVEKLRVTVHQFELLKNDQPSLRLKFKLEKPSVQEAKVDFEVETGGISEELQNVEAHGQLDLDHLQLDEPLLTVAVHAKGKHLAVKSDLTLAYFKDAASGELVSQIAYRMPKSTLILRPALHLQLERGQLKVFGHTPVEGLPGPVTGLRTVRLLATVPMQDGQAWSAQPSHVSVTAPVALFFIAKNMREPLEKSCACRVPEELLVNAEAEAWLKTLLEPSPERRPLADIKLKVEGVKNKLFNVDLAVGLRVEQQNAERFYQPTIDSDIVLNSFQGMRSYLDAKNVLIPAPLSSLDGTIEFTARGPIEFTPGTPNRFSTPLNLQVRLKSPTQLVNIDSQTVVKADDRFKEIDVAVQAKILDLQLEMPPLEPILGLPRLVRDSRLQISPPTSKVAPPSKLKLRLSVQVDTATPGAIRLLSKLAKPDVPISVQLHNQGKINTGYVRVEPFAITYLRRTVHVERFELNPTETSNGDFPINGRFRVDQTEYKVFIDVLGTTASPQITLTSDPDLSRDDIISVLLFDHTSTELGSGDSETSGNFQAAMADRAIGLFGLWAFATTPIRSFSYNSTTKVYTATVQLADGLTAGVGTDWEHAANLEVRKRLSRRWVLTASYSPSQDQRDVGQVVLQWEKRF